MSLDKLEDMYEYQVGLWYSPYVKIYSIGGKNRIAEISNHPRAYKDTTPHIYVKNTPFTVTKDDLNYEDENGSFHQDSKEDLYRLGEKATHWKWDSLLGAFPLWIEDENLPFTSEDKEHTFHLDKVPGPIVNLSEGEIRVGSIFVKLPSQALTNMREHIPMGKIILKRKTQDTNKQVIRIKYQRVF